MTPRPLLFEELSPVQRFVICNGCGAKGGWFKWLRPPALCFSTACDRHDYAYWVGGTKADRRFADRCFWSACKRAVWDWADIRGYGRGRVAVRMIAAWLFYRAVRLAGAGSFHHGTQRVLESRVALRLRDAA
ncbi:MAG: hypothetical protein H0X11_10720 [Betaproteobacteria bacterium]|nr:hypothetical protein [Betaproteobacteria bacterium]